MDRIPAGAAAFHLDQVSDRARDLNSLCGEARRIAIDEPGLDTAAALVALESTADPIGELEHHTGGRSLLTRFDVPEAGDLQWFRATLIEDDACVRGADVSI